MQIKFNQFFDAPKEKKNNKNTNPKKSSKENLISHQLDTHEKTISKNSLLDIKPSHI